MLLLCNLDKLFSRQHLGFAAKSLLVGLGVRSLRVSSRSFQALLPSLFVPVYVLQEG